MKPHFTRLTIVAAILLAGLTPLAPASAASTSKIACTVTKPCTLATGTKAVITFGIKGGSLRTWSVKIYSDGTIKADRIAARSTPFNDPTRTLGAFLILAEAEGFFSLQKIVSCNGDSAGPDSSGYFISFRTSSGTKRVTDYGSCKATTGFQQLFAVLSAAAGVSLAARHLIVRRLSSVPQLRLIYSNHGRRTPVQTEAMKGTIET